MAAYGFTDRLLTHVSIACPAHAKDVMIPWAAAGGMAAYPSEPDTIGILVDGETWKIYIEYLDMDEDDRFERIETVDMAFGHDGIATKVLTMPAIINQNAAAYIDQRTTDDWQSRQRVADNIVWLLVRISQGDIEGQSLTLATIPLVRDPRFWLVFTTAYPETAGLFYDAGLRAEYDEPERSVAPREWDVWDEEEEARPISPTSSYAPLLTQGPWPGSVDGEQTPRQRSPETHSTRRDGRERRPLNPLSHWPNLTRAEERRVMRDGMSTRPRRRSAGGRRFSKMFSLSEALEDLLPSGLRHGSRR